MPLVVLVLSCTGRGIIKTRARQRDADARVVTWCGWMRLTLQHEAWSSAESAEREDPPYMHEDQPGSEPHDGEIEGANQRERDADERQNLADDREAALDAREVQAEAKDSVRADRKARQQSILDRAAYRDDQAEARDSVADERDAVAGLGAFLHDDEEKYGAAHRARRSAALDRLNSKGDRTSAADDRAELSGDDPELPLDADDTQAPTHP
jgi:hypothetical protein